MLERNCDSRSDSVAPGQDEFAPNFLALEWHGMVVGPGGMPPDRPLIRDGYLRVSEGPGLGVDLNEPVARGRPRGRDLIWGVAVWVNLFVGMHGPGDVLLIG
jgi:hypothetical protein